MLSLEKEEEKSFLKRFDFFLAANVLFLHLIGLLVVYSATYVAQLDRLSSLFTSQLIWVVLSWFLYLFLTLFNYNWLKKICYPLYFLNLLALLAVKWGSPKSAGVDRWIDLGFFHYQPSETMKIILILVLAYEFSSRNLHESLNFRSLIKPLILILIPFFLIISQPDLGTAMILFLTVTSLLLFVKVKKSLVLGSLAALVLSLPLMWNYGLKTYQKNRVLTFLNPDRDPRGAGYNSIQSKIAVGSGAFWGKGFLEGTQSQLAFLPERHTDFIYSVLSEEFGFLGSLVTFTLFIFLLLQILNISFHSKDSFGALLVLGGGFYLFWHIFVNIGMVLGLLPVVGAPLPFLSYGGSSMITTMFFLGLVSSVSLRRYIF